MTIINVECENNYQVKSLKSFELSKKEIIKFSKAVTNFFCLDNDVFDTSCLKEFKFKKLYFDILLVDDNEIHQINKEYRAKDLPTDVITFAMFADAEPKFILDNEIALGEIIISLDTIEKQAIENGFSFKRELYYIISHGILHLLGFDHQTQPEYDFMVKKQLEVLGAIFDDKICK